MSPDMARTASIGKRITVPRSRLSKIMNSHGKDCSVPAVTTPEVMQDKAPAATAVRMIPVRDLNTNPWQPRSVINQGELTALTNSIRKYGFTGYLEARPDPTHVGKFQLVFGHRRLEAAKLAGVKELPVVVRKYDDKQMAELAVLENHSQEEMSYWDQALAVRRLIDEHGYSIRDLERIFGMSRGYVTNRLEIARLDPRSALAAAARQGTANMSTIQTLAKLQEMMSQTEIEDLLERAANKDITADQLRFIKNALTRAEEEGSDRFDAEGREILRVSLEEQGLTREDRQALLAGTDRRAIAAAREAAYRAQLEAERLQARGIDPVASIEVEAEESVLAKDTPDSTIIPLSPSSWTRITPRRTPPEDAARLALMQLRDNVRYLRQKLGSADLSALSAEERDEWNQLKEEMISLLA